MSEAATEMAADVAFSDAAARKVKRLKSESQAENLYLRRRLFRFSIRFFFR
jgi:hypothetical protein